MWQPLCLLLFACSLLGCCPKQTIARFLVMPERPGETEAIHQTRWQKDPVLSEEQIWTMDDGTQLAGYVIEPQPFAVDWLHDGKDPGLTKGQLAKRWQVPESAIRVAGRWVNEAGESPLPFGYQYRLWRTDLASAAQASADAESDAAKSAAAENKDVSIKDQNVGPSVLAWPCKGTVFLIQGWHAPVLRVPYLRPLACQLANAGYRVVMPDTRGQGSSGGLTRGMGALDAKDMQQVLTQWLEDHPGDGSPVYVVGHSYGGAVAMLWGLVDDRVDAVVGLSAVHDARNDVPAAIRGLAKRTDPLQHWFVSTFVSDQCLDEAMLLAAEAIGIDLKDASAMQTRQCHPNKPLLLLHGRDDVVCHAEWSVELWRLSPEHTDIALAFDKDHWSVLDHCPQVIDVLIDWLAAQGKMIEAEAASSID